jgi:hypothetical protein
MVTSDRGAREKQEDGDYPGLMIVEGKDRHLRICYFFISLYTDRIPRITAATEVK